MLKDDLYPPESHSHMLFTGIMDKKLSYRWQTARRV